MPRASAWSVAAVALGWGLLLARQEWRRPTATLCVDGGELMTLDGEPLASLVIRWRGSLAFVRWRDRTGRSGCLVGAPDVLGPSMRRHLRLVAAAQAPARTARSVAP